MPSVITHEDYLVLEAQNETTLAKWWCELNRWCWPAALPDAEARPERNEGFERRAQIMQWIERLVGTKVCLRAWNAGMGDAEFEQMWNHR